MTIDEALHRVVRGHWLIILLAVLVPVGAVIYLGSRQPTLYSAVSRVQVGTAPASSNVEADASSGRVIGIATSPGVVERALSGVGLADVDPVQFAQDHIAVQRIGVSTIMEIAVTDTRPSRAAGIATSVTNDVLDFANAGDRKPETDRVESLDKTIVSLGKSRDDLIAKLADAGPGTAANAIQAQINAIQTTIADDLRQRSELIVAASARSTAVLLDPVRTPTVPEPKGIPQSAALAGLMGLLGGLGLAAAWEAIRPTLRDPKAISLALGAPVIGHVDRRRMTNEGAVVLAPIADRMALLARRFNASRALLLPVRPDDDAWADEVAEKLGADEAAERAHRLECAALDGQWREPGRHPAAVVFTPTKIRARELVPTQELLASVDWPVLGVVTYDNGRSRVRGPFSRKDGRLPPDRVRLSRLRGAHEPGGPELGPRRSARVPAGAGGVTDQTPPAAAGQPRPDEHDSPSHTFSVEGRP